MLPLFLPTEALAAEVAPRVLVNLDSAGKSATRASWTLSSPSTAAKQDYLTVNGVNYSDTGSLSSASGGYTFSVSGTAIVMSNAAGASVATFGSEVAVTGPSANPLVTVNDASGPSGFRFTRYRGILKLSIVSGKLMLVNDVAMQDYLYSVVYAEIGNTTGNLQAAGQAQAICARSYVWLKNGSRISCTTSDQAYFGHSYCGTEARRRSGTVTAREYAGSTAAVDATDNRVLTVGGQVVQAYYAACNGDVTAHSEDVWSSKISHLRSVADPYCGRAPAHNHSWTVSMTGMQLAATLASRGVAVPAGAGTLVFVKGLRLSPATGGWVKTLTVEWSDLSATVTTLSNADRVRIATGLRSANFTVTATTDTTIPIFTFKGLGWGHGLGMSQQGALQMSREGKDFAAILKHYFTGSSTAIAAPVQVTAPKAKNTSYQENNKLITRSKGKWSRFSAKGYSGGKAIRATSKNAKLTMKFKGSGIIWYGATSSGGGRAQVYLDGKLVRTVNQHSKKTVRGKVIYQVSGLDATKKHTLKIVTITKSKSKKAGVVVLDRVVVRSGTLVK